MLNKTNEDKTNYAVLGIVAIVAIVGLILLFKSQGSLQQQASGINSLQEFRVNDLNLAGKASSSAKCEEFIDSGNDPYTKGYITGQFLGRTYTNWDRCTDSQTLREYFCKSANKPASTLIKCSSGCQDGACVVTNPCTNECSSAGTKQCSGNGYQVCGNYDSDSCLEWSSVTSCGASQLCSNGQCITPPPACTDECSSGSTRCNGNIVQTCGSYDSDSCLEWPSSTTGSGNTACSGSTPYCSNGACVQGQTQLKPYGWDYDLTKRCIKSTNPSAANYYQDLTDCSSEVKSWTVGIESEKSLTASCPGPEAQSFPINSPGSPVTMQWANHTSELGKNYAVNLHTDFSSITHPCGAGYYTWYAFMDHAQNNGGPYPLPNAVVLNVVVNYNDYTPNGNTRAMVGWNGFWDGKTREIELAFYQSPSWGDSYPNDPEVVNYLNTPTLQYVHVDGKAWNLSVTKLKDTQLKVEFYKIIQSLISKGYFETPSSGWQSTSTSAVWVSTETYSASSSNSVIASLWFTNFRVEGLS